MVRGRIERILLVSSLLAAVPACGNEQTDVTATGHEGEDAGADADASSSIMPAITKPLAEASIVAETGSGGGSDVDVQLGPDAADAPADQALDVPSNASAEAAVDGAADANADATVDAKAESSVDAGADADACVGDACVANICPMVEGYTINPIIVAVGEDVHLVTNSTDANGDPLIFHWTANQGTFFDANAASTTFRCTMAGTATISFSVSDGKCDDGFDQAISCHN